MNAPRDYYSPLRAQGWRHACEQLKAYVRDRQPRTEILAAIEALPDDVSKLEALPEPIRKALRAFLLDAEIKFHADRALEEIDRQFPELKP